MQTKLNDFKPWMFISSFVFGLITAVAIILFFLSDPPSFNEKQVLVFIYMVVASFIVASLFFMSLMYVLKFENKDLKKILFCGILVAIVVNVICFIKLN